MAENTPFTLQIDGETVTFKKIEAAHLRLDLASAMNENTNRAFAAALGLAWVGAKRPKATLERCRYNVLAYGGHVINELVKRGLTAVEVVTLGAAVFSQCVTLDGIVSDREVKEAAGFSEGGEGMTA